MTTWKLLAASVLLALVVPGTAGATESHTFTAPVPCAVTCPYWTDLDGLEAACRTPAETLLPESVADWEVVIPGGFSRLHFEMAPRFAYHSFLCYAPSNPGPNNTFFIETGVNPVGELCGPTFGILIGCAQEIDYCIAATAAACLAPGTNVIFRVYNWFDPGPSIVGTLEYLE